MPDIVDPATRSRMMSGIRGKNTKPEMAIRKALHAAGFRFRLHATDVPGKPDLVLPRYRAAVFVNGCFWHGHDCDLFRLPDTRRDFWQDKIEKNRQRDSAVQRQLLESSWRQLIVWECALKGRGRLAASDLLVFMSSWLTSAKPQAEVRGTS